MRLLAVITFILALISTSAYSSSIDMIGAQFSDERRETFITGFQGNYTLQPKRGYLSKRPLSLGLGYSRKQIKFLDLESFVVEEQLAGQNEITQNDLSFSISHNLSLITDVSVFYANSDSPLATSQSFGLSVSHWFRKETLKVQATLGQNSSEQASGEIYDTDQRRVRLPSDLEGQNAGVNVTHYTTPVLITTGSASWTKRSDRPDAHSQAIGIRRYIKKTRSAIHLGVGHYANVGQLTDDALFGHVSAFSFKGEWHQRFRKSYILMGGYRYYSENVTARHDLESEAKLASDAIYAMLRYRFGHKRWLEESHEAQVFFEQYTTTEPRNGTLIGLGLSLKID